MPDPNAKPAPPTRIGGFEILETLGKGGMGTVYKARQVSMDRLVALKVLPPRLAKNEAFVQRFVREARSAARLNHPNIVQGFDVGEAEGCHYFAMELVDGPTVKDLLKREGRLDEKKALSIVGAVARALEHAHKQGIIHRDIKPDNIMINRDGVVKLADLGLARSTETPDTVTIEGTQLGTPYYMAPEQVRGETDLDTRADIYALGATLYHLVTGEFPYNAPTAAAIMARQLSDPIPWAKDKSPDLSAATCALIGRMMAKSPADRPQTPTELLAEIRDALAGAPPPPRDLPSAPSPPVGRGRGGAAAPAPSSPLAPPRTRGGEGGGAVAGAPLRPDSGRASSRERPTLAGPPPRAHHRPAASKTKPYLIVGGILVAILATVIYLVTRPGLSPLPPGEGRVRDAGAAASQTASPPAQTTKVEPPKVEPPKPAPDEALDAELATLRSECDALAAKDQFAQALKQIDAFGKVLASRGLEARGRLLPGLRTDLLAKAERRYEAIAAAADDAAKSKDFPKARAALKTVEAFGLPDLADRAAKKLAEIDSREKSAEAWAKWDAIKSQAKKLADAGQFDDAAKLLDGAKAIPLDNIADLVAEQMESIESIKSTRLKAALAAYAAESDKVWALFKDRKYADADKLLAELAAKPEFIARPAGAGAEVVRPAGAEKTRVGDAGYVSAADRLKADQEAAKLLKEFWAAVEKGLSAKAGQFISFRGAAGGTLVAVQDGTATVKTPKGEEPRRVQDLVAKQALAHADLRDDAHSNLLRGVFLLAEGEDLPKAEKAFDNAGDGANLARYKERLGALAPPKVATPAETTPKVQPVPTRKWVVYKDWPFDAAEAVRRQKATAQALGVEVEHDIDLGNGVKMAFVLIPAGEFLMGSPSTTSPQKLAAAYGGDPREYEREIPQHRVRISNPFWLGKYEVTQQEWEAVIGDNPSNLKGNPQNPVENVSWSRSEGFVDRLSTIVGRRLRLPTEAEWEYACRAGSAAQFCFGDKASEVKNYAWYVQNAGGSPHPVGQLKPNAWGLYDMHGNVWEWCSDWYAPYGKEPVIDPKGPAAGTGRVNRGGSCGNFGPLLWGCRSAERCWFDTERSSHIAGFRAVLERLGGAEGATKEAPKVTAEDLKAGKWVGLFDGKTLTGWRAAAGGFFLPGGSVEVADGALALKAPKDMATGLACTRKIPLTDYELSFDLMRTSGQNAAIVVFPIGSSQCAWAIGNFQNVSGLDQADGKGDTVKENPTYRIIDFPNDQWFHFRLRVERDRIQGWRDDEAVLDIPRRGHAFTLWSGYDGARPLGLAVARFTEAKLRNIRLRRLGE